MTLGDTFLVPLRKSHLRVVCQTSYSQQHQLSIATNQLEAIMFSRTLRTIAVGGLLIAGLSGTSSSSLAGATAVPITILVDHVDQANQQPFAPFNRLFEYTDFFARSVTVHQGDTIDFQAQPGSFHIVALAADQAAARRAYPTNPLDTDNPDAPGSGLPKIGFGTGNFPVTGGSVHGGGAIARNNGKGPPVCGAVEFGEAPCRFRGGADVEVIGPTVGYNFQQQPATINQNVVIDAVPGTYTYFDMLHPGMTGTVQVVAAGHAVTTQAQIDTQSATQFAADRTQALSVESALNGLPDTPGDPGHRVIPVFVGASAANDHVEIDEMLPNRTINATPGDQVVNLWADDHAQHTVGFASSEAAVPEPFGYDCTPAMPSYQQAPNVFNAPPPVPPCLEPGRVTPEPIGDPGNAPSGTVLTGVGNLVDSGLRIGLRYGSEPTSQVWSVAVGSQTVSGSHPFFCGIHPWMQGMINVS